MYYVYNKLEKILFTRFYPGKVLLRLTMLETEAIKIVLKPRKKKSLLPCFLNLQSQMLSDF